MNDLSIRKIGSAFKIYSRSSRSLIERIFPGLQRSFVQAKPHRMEQESVDLSFSNIEFAKLFIKSVRRLGPATEEQAVTASRVQLDSMFKAFDINPGDFGWADLWCGRRNWAIALSQITGKVILAVDRYDSDYGPPFYSPLVNFLRANTSDTPLPKNVTACFLRSTVGAESLCEIANLNPNVRLFVIVPEGIGSNEGLLFEDLMKPLENYFNAVIKSDLRSEIGIKGTHSQRISFNQYFPVIVARR